MQELPSVTALVALACFASWSCAASGPTHDFDVVIRNGQIIPISDFFPAREGEEVRNMTVRFRTVGDLTCTAGVESPASTIEDIIAEVAAARASERGARMDDKTSEAAMEDRKKEGYF